MVGRAEVTAQLLVPSRRNRADSAGKQVASIVPMGPGVPRFRTNADTTDNKPSGAPRFSAAEILTAAPFMTDAAHKERAIEFHRSPWKPQLVLEVTGADSMNFERLDIPAFAAQLEAVVSTPNWGSGVTK